MSVSWEDFTRETIDGRDHIVLIGAVAGVPTELVTLDPDDPTLTRDQRAAAMDHLETYVEGRCPKCGAEVQGPNRTARRAAKRSGARLRATVAHDRGCPLADEMIATTRGRL